MISFIGKLVFTTIGLRVEGCHHTDAADFVLRVHVVTLITERSEIHTCRCTHAVDEGDDWLTQFTGIIDSLLVIVLCPSGTSRSVDDEDMTSTQGMIGRFDHHVTMVYRTIRATATISGDRTIDGEYRNKREVLSIIIITIQCPLTSHLLTILRNLIFLWVID